MLIFAGVDRSFSSMNRLCNRLRQRCNTWSLRSAYHHCSRRSGFANQDTTNRNSLQMVHKPSKKDSTADSISHVTMYIVFQGTKNFEIGYFEMWKITLQRSHLVVQIQYLYKYYPGILTADYTLFSMMVSYIILYHIIFSGEI